MGSATVLTRHSVAPVLLPDVPAPTRKDILGLATPSLPLGTVRPEVTLKCLRDLGFSINQPTLGHWILTLGQLLTEVHLYSEGELLTEVHLYSEGELEQFARYKAHDYAERALEETNP